MFSSSKQLDEADMSFVDYVDSLRIPYEEIELATNNFIDKSLLPIQSPSSSFFPKLIYKGQLEQSGGQLLDIVARKISKEQDNIVFNELVTSYLLQHKNIHSIFKICDTDEPIIVSKYEANGGLDEHLGDLTLTWMQRLHICLGVAQTLSYLHDFSVIHGNIKSSKILLDENWEPKLNCFGFSMFVKKHQPHLISNYNVALQYVDPGYVNKEGLTHKSDVFSFGVVLFEVLFGEIASVKDKDNWYFAKLARSVYEEKTLDDTIDADLHQQMDLQALQIFSEAAYLCLKEISSQRPDMVQVVTKLETALSHQQKHEILIMSLRKDLAHLKIPLENILSATNNFADENGVIAGSGVGKEYKGEFLLSSELISIAAMRLNKERNQGELQFFMEVSVLSKLKHKNLISIVGFCDENGEKIIIRKHEARGRLDEYLSDPMLLTWVRRLEICVGISHALSYIYYDEARDFSVIHRNITSNTIVLNDDWEPKLSGFEFSITIGASERNQSFHADTVWYPEGYMDPTYIETESAHHKSDIYSFGIVLFELLCGRKSIIAYENNTYFASLAIFHYKEKTLDNIVDPDIWKQIDPRSLDILAKVAYECLSEERSQRPNIDEIVTRLEKALELQLERQISEHSIVATELEGTSDNYEKGSTSHFISTSVEFNSSKNTMSPLKYLSHQELSIEDLKSATNNFAPEYLIRDNAVAWVYQGRMLHTGKYIDIVARGIYPKYHNEESKKFRMEKSMLSSLRHTNLVSLIGFCDKNDDMFIVYKKEANGNLKKYLSDETLTWMQRLKICVGIANALSYIYYDVGRDFSVIHCNIRSSKILLDDNWEPKLSGFNLSLMNTVARRHRLVLTRDIVENAYLDPKYKTTGGVTHKSDVYSFGVLLFEVLCGKSALLPDEELEDGLLLSQLANSHLEDMIHPHLREQMDPEAFKIFSENAYYCIQEERAKRPYIDQVVNKLEKALELQWKHENPTVITSSDRLKGGNIEHLKIGLDLINEATKNFDDAYCFGSNGFAKMYKADLEHFDSSNFVFEEGVNECNLPRKRSTVAIMRYNYQEGEEFIAEIEALTSCKHENIISLLGFCYEGNGAMILVFEHASKGSLENYLGSGDKMTNLTWVQRLNICLDIAHGLNYIHNNTDHGKQKMIHSDIMSDNILLGDNWKAKIADFGFSKFHPASQAATSTIYTGMIAGTYMYLDPEYQKYGRLNKKSDIYSFGVVLLEILTGRLAYDSVYTKANEKGIAPIARDHFKKGTIMEIVDHKIKEETDEHVFSLSKGPNKESLDIFLEIAFQCVAETQAQRPTIEIVIKELKKALNCQENHKDNLKLSLKDVKLATQDFSQHNIIGNGDFGNVYRGKATHGHQLKIVAAKRLDKKNAEGEAQFATELEILMEYRHENVIGLVGYCDEEDEKIIVYNYASRGSLDKCLSDDSLTWVMRLKICIDIAIGLEFLHGTVSSPEMVIHRDISSCNILLFDDWKAKISDFGLSLVCPRNEDAGFVIDNTIGTIGYRDPLYLKTGFLTKESDIFSLGVVLIDILCGKLSSESLEDEYLYLPFLAKQLYHLGKLDELVFEGIKEQLEPDSLITFARIAYQCLHEMRERRPTAHEVVIQLNKALELQEDYEKWEPKLPKDYKKIIQMSKCPEIYSTRKNEELYNTFTKGILLQQDKVCSFDGDGARNILVSATTFTYVNSCPHWWRSLKESRFEKVAEMSDISNLNIEIKTDTQLLSPNIVYGVYFVFKLCDSRKFSAKPMYVNLKYRKESETLQAYFATQRDEKWMMIELYRFLNQNEDVVFKFLLESFSSYYCGDGAIYVEGIEFRAIGNVKHDEIGYLNDVQQVLISNFNTDQVQQWPTGEVFEIHENYDELFWLGEVKGKKLLVLSAKAALYKFSDVGLLTSKHSTQSRFQEVIELLPQQVFYINSTFRSQMLSPDTEYVCYLVFKISEQYQGLHNPVKVRDLLSQEHEESESFIYFITPNQLNIHDWSGVPKEREDGWMEIQVWKLKLTHEDKDESCFVNVKFTSPEGPMSGLFVYGLEFRPL